MFTFGCGVLLVIHWLDLLADAKSSNGSVRSRLLVCAVGVSQPYDAKYPRVGFIETCDPFVERPQYFIVCPPYERHDRPPLVLFWTYRGSAVMKL